MKSLLLVLGCAAFLLIALSETSYGIPAFSRKYKTSCATCHVAFPKLTAFGDAFRRNGYQFPDGGDEAATKEEPVSLGAEGNKKAFPDALWPSTIPGSVPIGIVAELEATYAPHRDTKWEFGSLEGEVEVLTGGTLGEDISFYTEVGVADDAVEIERANVVFSNLDGGTTSMFNVKVGKFEPGVFSFSNHRRISPRYGITTGTLGDNQWSLEGAQKGIEINGVVGNGRLGYNAALVEGRGNLDNSQKDFYGHLTYKFNGMRLDGVAPENTGSAGATQPWQDNSVTVGGFVYHGTATLDGSSAGTSNIDDEFTMFGADVNVWYDRLNVIAAVAQQNDKNPFVATPGVKSDLTSFMIEGSYIVYPWFIPLARFENSKVKGAPTANSRIISAIQFLVRANVRCALEANFATEPSSADPNKTEFKFEEFALGITIGI
jgi:hypothetical protein